MDIELGRWEIRIVCFWLLGLLLAGICEPGKGRSITLLPKGRKSINRYADEVHISWVVSSSFVLEH